MVLIGLYLMAALASYNVNDPSFNTATTAAPTNWLGAPGAYVADLLMQSFGLAAFILAFPLVSWGASLILHGTWRATDEQTIRRVLSWGVALLGCGAALSAASTPGGWPLNVGLGGLSGYAFAHGNGRPITCRS